MSSLEIAELTGKRHDDVTRDIRKLLKAVDLKATDFSVPVKMPSGQTANVYELDKQLTLTLVAGYNVKMRHAIIKRWQYLECDLTLQAVGLKATEKSVAFKMSSLEIAELTGKRHDHVLVDIRKLLKAVGLQAPDFLVPLKMPSGQTANVYNLTS